MDSKEAANILIELSKKKSITAKEKKAVLMAVGTLGWTALAESRIKRLKEKREKDMQDL